MLVPLTCALDPADAGAKASRLSAALQAGLPVLPGWVLPVSASRTAIQAGAAAIRSEGIGAGRRGALRLPLQCAVTRELEAAVAQLGGRVIVRSSSPLEADPRWSGAFASVSEVGQADVANAVRSCWASALGPDPLRRLELSGLPLEAAELAVLLQPEISPVAGGVARLAGAGEDELEVTIEAIAGHPGALLAGLADGLTCRLRGNAADPDLAGGDPLATMIGLDGARAVARLALGVWQKLGDDLIEWAAWHDGIWLLQSLRQGVGVTAGDPEEPASAHDVAPLGVPASANNAAPAGPASAESMLALAERVQRSGRRVQAVPVAPGATAGRLIICRQHEPAPPDCREAVLLIERPLPSYAPLLFSARGVIATAGTAGSHLAEVARSLGVPMVVGCRLEAVTTGNPAGQWLVAMDGGSGDVAVMKDA